MPHNNTLKKIEDFSRERLKDDNSGHDFEHTDRVRKLAIKICQSLNANVFIVEASALLHDVGDRKFFETKEDGENFVIEYINNLEITEDEKEQIIHIIKNLSFSSELQGKILESIEGYCVQDADRIDGLGAIGIGRAFMYASKKNNPMYTFTNIRALDNANEYMIHESGAINHLLEKMPLVVKNLKTNLGKEIGAKRYKFLQEFTKKFIQEWNLEDI